MNTQTLNYEREINGLVKKLNQNQQYQLLKSLRMQNTMAQVEKLKGSILPNNITMDEIVEEVRIVRKNRNAPKTNYN